MVRMTAELRARLKAAQDAQARRRVRTEPRFGNERHGQSPFCSGCDGPIYEWTLGCPTCRERHRAYHKRMFYPNGEAWYLTRKAEHTEFHAEHRRQHGRASYAK